MKRIPGLCSAIVVGCLVFVGCGDDGLVGLARPDLGYDLGFDGGPPRQCEQFDGGDPAVDLGLGGDLGPITEIPDGGPPADAGPDHPFGCLPLKACLADVGDPGELTYENFAAPLFATYCVRCHSVANVGDIARGGAPRDVNLDVRESVYANLPRIRQAAGVQNFMPFNAPRLPCERRAQLVTWIDRGAP